MRRRFAPYARGAILFTGVLLSACSTGPLNVREQYFIAVTNGRDTNYFRLTVSAGTTLGNAELRQGWFPANAVDSLFGDVSDEGGPRAVVVRETMRKQIDNAAVKTNEAYLNAASSPEASTEQLDKLLLARNRVLLAPKADANAPDLQHGQIIQYDPGRGLLVTRSDEKLVFVLGSDPDQVIGAIAGFAEEEKTAATVLKLTDALVQQRRNELAGRGAASQVSADADALIGRQLTAASAAIEGSTRDQAIERLDILLSLVRALERSGP